jgi:hypothetical protein
MPISIQCDCGRKLKARDEFAGSRAECPTCGRTLQIPAAATAAPGPDSGAAASPAGRTAEFADKLRQPLHTGDAEPLEIVEFLDPPKVAPAPAQPQRPRKQISMRMMFEALLDPRSIQWMLMLGGGLLVLGVIIWLVSLGIFKDPVVLAVAMGIGTLAILGGGWWLELKTRFRTAGQALTFLGCVVAPLNLWFYDAQELIKLDQNLWIGGLVCCLLYIATVYVLRDPLFMYAVEGGVTLTVLLLLANWHQFTDSSALCLVLVVLGLISIHAERAFDPAPEAAFNRGRFGMPLFWSGHAQLASALVLLLGTQAWGWLFHPGRQLVSYSWEGNFLSHSSVLAGGLWLAGTYAYLYSDLVVRRIGIYTYIAAFCLLMGEMTLVWRHLHAEGAIAILALTALAANVVRNSVKNANEKLNRAVPPLALGLSALPVVLGLAVHVRATSELVINWGLASSTDWLFVVVMLLVAVSNRISAYLVRHEEPTTSAVYFFFSAGALIVAAAALLRQVGVASGLAQASLVMLVPLAYLVAARLWMGHTPERPLVWVAHAGTAVILLHVLFASLHTLATVVQPVAGARDNLLLGLVFTEAALFYVLAGIFRKRSANIYLASAAACGALWQFMGYWGTIDQHYFTMLYAVLGIALLAAGRAVGLEQVKMYGADGGDAPAMRGRGLALFQSGNAILFVALLAAFLQGLAQLVTHNASWLTLSSLLLTTAASFAAIPVVPAGNWRRLYWTTSLSMTGLSLLTIHVLSLLSGWQKFEIFCVIAGIVLIVAGYINRFREQPDEYSDSLTLGLWVGSALVTLPLIVALCYWRFYVGDIHWPEELGIVVFSILMLVTGFSWQVKSTTVAGGGTLFLYLIVTIGELAYRPQVATGIYLVVGGAVVFVAGIVLSIYRDKLLALPDKIARREGVFQVIGWR